MTAEHRAFDVDDAVELARTAHAGQEDKLKRDYFVAHLLPIAERLRPLGDEAVMAGLLHDVLEDTEVTAENLRARGVPERVIVAVESVTKRAGEEYDDLIARAAADPLGVHVKLADNAHNLESNHLLAGVDPAKALELRQKYERARTTLEIALTKDRPS